MPLETCELDGKDGYRWGSQGKCYTYSSGDASGRDEARESANAQGRAAAAAGAEYKAKDEVTKAMTQEYLEGVLGKARELMTSGAFEKLHRFARASAGGKIKGKNYKNKKAKDDEDDDNEGNSGGTPYEGEDVSTAKRLTKSLVDLPQYQCVMTDFIGVTPGDDRVNMHFASTRNFRKKIFKALVQNTDDIQFSAERPADEDILQLYDLVLVKKDESHVHELPDGSFTGPPVHKEGGHTHLYGDGRETGLGKGEPLIHYHATEDGEATGHPVIAIAKNAPAIKKEIITLLQPFAPMSPDANVFDDPTDAVAWASSRLPVQLVTALNGETMIIHKNGDKNEVLAYFGDDLQTNVAMRFPELLLSIKSVPGDFILDVDLGIRKGGQRVHDLEKLRADNPRLDDGERLELTLMDMVYTDRDISDLSSEDRRVWLNNLYNEHFKDKVPIARLAKRRVAEDTSQIVPMLNELYRENQSVGAFISPVDAPYLAGPSPDLAVVLKKRVISKATELALAALGYASEEAKDESAAESEETKSCPIFKADDERRLIYGIVLEPDTKDSHGDKINRDEIEKAAHFFLKKSRVIGLGHSVIANASPVESYLSPVEFLSKGPFGEQVVKEGTWILVVHVPDDDQWAKVKDGSYEAFSVGGFGLRDKE